MGEVDRELRSVQLCYCFLEISPTERHEMRVIKSQVIGLMVFAEVVFCKGEMLAGPA